MKWLPLAIIGTLFGIFAWFTDRIDSKVEKVEEEVDIEENINIKQSGYIEQIQQNQLKFIEEFKELQQAK